MLLLVEAYQHLLMQVDVSTQGGQDVDIRGGGIMIQTARGCPNAPYPRTHTWADLGLKLCVDHCGAATFLVGGRS